MKHIKKYNQINESSEKKVKITVSLEMSEESGKNLQGYYDTNTTKDAITQYIQELWELDGVDFKMETKEE